MMEAGKEQGSVGSHQWSFYLQIPVNSKSNWITEMLPQSLAAYCLRMKKVIIAYLPDFAFSDVVLFVCLKNLNRFQIWLLKKYYAYLGLAV
jgi:undecaprenyl pyrophosphate phosphatase UppP